MAANSDGTAKRGKGRPFEKGKSGNPKGRPKVPKDVKEMLKAAVPDAVQLLIDTMMSEETKPELRVKCAETIIERVHGKATQPIEGDLTGGIVITFAEQVKGYAN